MEKPMGREERLQIWLAEKNRRKPLGPRFVPLQKPKRPRKQKSTEHIIKKTPPAKKPPAKARHFMQMKSPGENLVHWLEKQGRPSRVAAVVKQKMELERSKLREQGASSPTQLMEYSPHIVEDDGYENISPVASPISLAEAKSRAGEYVEAAALYADMLSSEGSSEASLWIAWAQAEEASLGTTKAVASVVSIFERALEAGAQPVRDIQSEFTSFLSRVDVLSQAKSEEPVKAEKRLIMGTPSRVPKESNETPEKEVSPAGEYSMGVVRSKSSMVATPVRRSTRTTPARKVQPFREVMDQVDHAFTPNKVVQGVQIKYQDSPIHRILSPPQRELGIGTPSRVPKESNETPEKEVSPAGEYSMGVVRSKSSMVATPVRRSTRTTPARKVQPFREVMDQVDHAFTPNKVVQGVQIKYQDSPIHRILSPPQRDEESEGM